MSRAPCHYFEFERIERVETGNPVRPGQPYGCRNLTSSSDGSSHSLLVQATFYGGLFHYLSWRWTADPWDAVHSSELNPCQEAVLSSLSLASNIPTSSTKDFRTVGSPPVSLIFFTPVLTKSVARRMISSSVSMLGAGLRAIPSLGIQ